MIDISIIIPSIRVQNLYKINEQIKSSISPFSYELIIIGPEIPPVKLDNCIYIKSFSCPVVAAQLGTIVANGRLIVQGSDDARYFPGTLANCIRLYDQFCNEKDFVAVKYSENMLGRDPNYFTCNFHDDLRLPSLNNMRFSPLCLLSTKRFREIGGWDCINFSCLNMPALDLCFRLQLDGGRLYFSPDIVLDCVWEQGESGTHKPVHFGELQNDIPNFNRIWRNNEQKIYINYMNWQFAPTMWERRFNQDGSRKA